MRTNQKCLAIPVPKSELSDHIEASIGPDELSSPMTRQGMNDYIGHKDASYFNAPTGSNAQNVERAKRIQEQAALNDEEQGFAPGTSWDFYQEENNR